MEKKKLYFKNLHANPGQNCRQIPSISSITPYKIVKEKKVLQKAVCNSWSKLQTDSIHTFPNAYQTVKEKKVLQKPVCKSWSKLHTDFIHTFPNAYQIVKEKKVLQKPVCKSWSKLHTDFIHTFPTAYQIVKEKKVLQKPVCKSWSKLQTDFIHTFPNFLQNCKRKQCKMLMHDHNSSGGLKRYVQNLFASPVKIENRFHPYLILTQFSFLVNTST